MANIVLTTLQSDCRSPTSHEVREPSASGFFSAADIPTPFDSFWDKIGRQVIEARISKCSIRYNVEGKNQDGGLTSKIETPRFVLTVTLGARQILVNVSPQLVRGEEVDYVCKGYVPILNSSASGGLSRKNANSCLQMIGCGLKHIHEDLRLDYKFGLVTVEFEYGPQAVIQVLKSPMTINTTMQEMIFDRNRGWKIVTIKAEDGPEINYGIFVKRFLHVENFELRYYPEIENVCETVLRCFPSNCVSRFEPFLECCDLVGVISNCGSQTHHRITVITTAEHKKAHQWPVLSELQNLRLICELEDQVLDVGLMLEVEPEFFHDRVDYTCKGTLLGGFLPRTVLKEWSDTFESAVAYLHNSSHSICKPYGEFRIVFYSDIAGLRAPSLTSVFSETSVCAHEEVSHDVQVSKPCLASVSPALSRKVVVRNQKYLTLVLKKKIMFRTQQTIYFNSKKHFDLVAFVRHYSEDKLKLDLLSTRRVLDSKTAVVWPDSNSPKELVILFCEKELVAGMVIFKKEKRGISYYYALAPLELSRLKEQDEAEIQSAIVDVVSYFHDRCFGQKQLASKNIHACDHTDESFNCLKKIALNKVHFLERWIQRIDNIVC